jgi:hypothetical protein
MDVVTFRDRVLALNNNYGGDASLEILTPDLAPVASVALGAFRTAGGIDDSKVHRLAAVRGVPFDRDHDGLVGSDEIFDFVFAAGAGGIIILDISDLDDPRVVGRVALPGIIRELDIDSTGRLLLAGGDRTATTSGDEGIFFINLADPFAAAAIDPATGRDVRVAYFIAYPGGVSGFKIDNSRGRVYVGFPGVAPSSGGVDVWAFTKRGTVNRPPIGIAGAAQSVVATATVRLDGTQSSDRDGDTITFDWNQTSGPGVTLHDTDTAEPWFIAPDLDAAVLTFSVVVRDQQTVSAPATVTITVHR